MPVLVDKLKTGTRASRTSRNDFRSSSPLANASPSTVPSAGTNTRSPLASDCRRSSVPCRAANKVAAATAVSSMGSGAATLPSVRHTTEAARAPSPSPPSALETTISVQPSSAICRHKARSKLGVAPRNARRRERCSARVQKSAALSRNMAASSLWSFNPAVLVTADQLQLGRGKYRRVRRRFGCQFRARRRERLRLPVARCGSRPAPRVPQVGVRPVRRSAR